MTKNIENLPINEVERSYRKIIYGDLNPIERRLADDLYEKMKKKPAEVVERYISYSKKMDRKSILLRNIPQFLRFRKRAREAAIERYVFWKGHRAYNDQFADSSKKLRKTIEII